LFEVKQNRHKFITMRSDRHKLVCYEINKMSLIAMVRIDRLHLRKWNTNISPWSLKKYSKFGAFLKHDQNI